MYARGRHKQMSWQNKGINNNEQHRAQRWVSKTASRRCGAANEVQLLRIEMKKLVVGAGGGGGGGWSALLADKQEINKIH